MKKVIKIPGIVMFLFLLLFSGKENLYAASANISVSSNKTTAVVGSTVTVSVRISSSQALGSWEYVISYDSSKLKLQSDSKVVGYGDGSQKSSTETFTFKVIASGTSTVGVQGYGGYAWENLEELSISAGSTRITGVTQAELEASYSKNNNLSSLSVKDYNISPEFNKDTLEYSVMVPSNVEKVTIEGALEDRKASATGFGEFDVSEGENKFDIVVTAENGSQKTYVVKLNVQDENPIETVIDGITYTVVKRGSTLTAPSTFEATTQMINGIEVPAFKSSITNFVLVGLKSKEGTPRLYIYNENDNSYTLYREIKTEGTLIFPTKAKVVPDNYKKVKITINDEEVEAYEYNNTSSGFIKKLNAATNGNGFYLIYGVNVETGEEDFYQFDAKLNTLSRYNKELIDTLTKENKNFLMIIIVLSVETVVMLLILLVSFVKRGKKKRRKNDFANFDDFPEKEKTNKKEVIKEENQEKKENKKDENKPVVKKEEKKEK